MKFLLWLFILSGVTIVSTSNKRNSRHHRIKGEFRIASSFEDISPTTTSGDVCETWWCGRGRECRAGIDGIPECICIRECRMKSKTVCGSDGRIYHSHCELHRAACLTKSQIAIDHSKSCVKTETKNHQSESGNWEQNHLHSKYLHEDRSYFDSPASESHDGIAEGKNWVSPLSPPSSLLQSKRNGEGGKNKESLTSQKRTLDLDGNSEMDLDSVLLADEESIAGGISRDSTLCSPQEYEILKDNLLLYNHERMIGSMKSRKGTIEADYAEKFSFDSAFGERPEAGKDYLLSLMFSHLDRNNDGALEYDELHKADMEENFGKSENGCKLTDFLLFDDPNHDGKLHINEFYLAFSKLYSVTMISLDKALEIRYKKAVVGENVELKCAVTGSPPTPVVWKRYGIDLSTLRQEDQIRVNIDGSLYLSNIQMLHTGNYSCHAQRNLEVVQTHILTVKSLPDVSVMPSIIWEKPGEEVTIECRVSGEPIPDVQWLRNDDPLSSELPGKYVVSEDGTRLTLRDLYYSDTGTYKCEAQNSEGKQVDVASLVVIDQHRGSSEPPNESQLLVFHGKGISSFDPENCRLIGQIMDEDVIPGAQGQHTCGKQNIGCDWGRAVRVSSTYVYASQPSLDRILVFSVSKNSIAIVDVISTDRYPVELHYIPYLDQVWVECWGEESDDSQKTLQVIRNAKEKRSHNSVHPDPINSHFDLVQNIFLPPDLKSSSQFRFAYVSHSNVRKLYKMNLVTLRYTKSVDLTPYNCVPQHVQFSGLYGTILVECFEPVTHRPTGQLVIDALTDAVVTYQSDRLGRPYLSPDSRKLVTILPDTVTGTKLLVQLNQATGLQFAFDIKTSLNISDVAFFPSRRTHTYDLFATAKKEEEILFVDLETGNTETISDVGFPPKKTLWKNAERPLLSQGLFGKHIATTSTESVVVIDGISRMFDCEIEALFNPQLLVWV